MNGYAEITENLSAEGFDVYAALSATSLEVQMSSTAYVGTTKRIWIRQLALNGTAVTAVDGGDSVEYTLLNQDLSTYASGNGTHDANGDWYADVTMPSSAQDPLHVHWVVTKTGAVEKFHTSIVVVPFI